MVWCYRCETASDGAAAVAAGSGAGSGPGAGTDAARTGLASSMEVSAPPSGAGRGACPPRLGGGELIADEEIGTEGCSASREPAALTILALLGRAREWPLAMSTPQAGRAMSTPSCPHRRTKRLFMFQGEYTTLSVSWHTLRSIKGEISGSDDPLKTNRPES